MFPQTQEPKKESLPGIIATIIALMTGAALIVLVLLAAYMETTTRGGIDEESSAAMIIGLLFFAVIPVSFIGTILGFAGLFQKNRRKTFPVFGAFLNLTIFCAIIVLIIFGLLAS